ncbi:MAG: MurT ligase domain-containing protein [Bifidobacteriaceae bacterium]|jgi:UDP-N-acetylmuramyl tripeptide synthase|nr:MurT ligase domain-containing protein [Bifidobacteriaceae bacterium]
MRFYIILGKLLRALARLRGGGSALPGMVIEKLCPDFLSKMLLQLPLGVAVITGTNGKTTTTRIASALLESQNLRVFTNPTGSNFTRGVISAILEKADCKGNLPYDIAILELDEAYAVHFANKVQPEYSLHLNVMRDQLDRFGEIDNTQRMLYSLAERTTKKIVLNSEDYRIMKSTDAAKQEVDVSYFSLAPELKALFPTDDELYDDTLTKQSVISQNTQIQSKTRNNSQKLSKTLTVNATTLLSFTDSSATYLLNGESIDVKLKVRGLYNIYNVAAALQLVNAILDGDFDKNSLISALENVTPAFGRGEKITLNNGAELELVLVKNPSGFRLALESFENSNADDKTQVMIAISDEYADGRDMSWLWDVDFTPLHNENTTVSLVSGTRAYDMALRLMYDLITPTWINDDIKSALSTFTSDAQNAPINRIYCTYTAMLKIRSELAKVTEIQESGLK